MLELKLIHIYKNALVWIFIDWWNYWWHGLNNEGNCYSLEINLFIKRRAKAWATLNASIVRKRIYNIRVCLNTKMPRYLDGDFNNQDTYDDCLYCKFLRVLFIVKRVQLGIVLYFIRPTWHLTIVRNRSTDCTSTSRVYMYSYAWSMYAWTFVCTPGCTCAHVHNDVIKYFPRHWHFVRGIHWPPVNSPHRGQLRGALMFSLICTWNQQLSKQWRRLWFETPLRSLWHHCFVSTRSYQYTGQAFCVLYRFLSIFLNYFCCH